ncbi:MAG: MATE family efflux transporter [Clostridia bacterium]|nr:MATE family efflux transporter [Clostridia bacterium]
MVRDLTSGKPSKVLRSYTIPMFLSVIFQQLYNIADSVIAGRFAGEDALAAVGASYPVTMIFNAVAIGCNIGCSVVIARIFGSHDYVHTRTAISTTVISAVVASVGLTAAGLAACTPVMRLLNTPENIFDDSALYLKIYIGGFAFLFLYNIATAVFVSVGDSKTPLFFLICSSVGNIILDYVFVKFFNWGVAGVAWATFIAQGAACILALITVSIRIKEIKITEKYKKFSFSTLWEICLVAIPSILQQSFVSVGNLFIQRLINSFGSSVIAGYSAAIKLNTFCITSLTTLGNGISGYTAQNIGAKKLSRIDSGFGAGLLMSLFITIPFSVAYFFAGEPLIMLFLEEGNADALKTGMDFLKITSPFYCPIAFKILADGVLRGTGKMKAFMVTTFADLILRVIFAYLLSPDYGTNGIWAAWPIGWLTCTVMSVCFYMFYRRKRQKIKG